MGYLNLMATIRHPVPPDWVAPGSTYFIAALHRSGSSMLAEALAATGVLGRPREYFNQRTFPASAGDIVSQCEMARRSATRPGDVVGIKFMPGHFDRLCSAIDLSAWFPNSHWIWIRRRDVLGQAISWVIAEQTGAWDSSQPASAEPHYDAGRIADRLAMICFLEARWTMYFSFNKFDPIELWYEDLCAGALADAINRISARLGVEPDANWPTKLTMRKQRNSITQAWRDRFLEGRSSVNELPSIDRLALRPFVPRTPRNLLRFVRGCLPRFAMTNDKGQNKSPG